MKETQKVSRMTPIVAKLLYAANYWLTLSEKQHEDIYQEMGW